MSKATKQTLNITPKDVGHTLVVAETVENGFARSQAADSAATVVVPKPPPVAAVHKSPPTITGADEQSHTLTGHAAPWTGEPKSFEYQWQRCESGGLNCHAINNAQSTKYTLTGADVGKVIEFRETATNAAGSAISVSAPPSTIAPAAPVNIEPPSISGAPEQAHGLRELHGQWSNEPEEFSYQWEHCDGSGNNCEAISGANSRNYAPRSGEVGDTLRVQERAINTAGMSSPATSAPTGPGRTHARRINVKPPTVTGNPQQGETLTAHPGAWKPTPTHHSFQWLRCEAGECRTIEGATKTTYARDARRRRLLDRGQGSGREHQRLGSGVLRRPCGRREPDALRHLPRTRHRADDGRHLGASITGGNFAEASAVSFGSVKAASYEVLSPGEIRAVSPAQSAGTVTVTVTTPKGTSAVNSGSQYTYGVAAHADLDRTPRRARSRGARW